MATCAHYFPNSRLTPTVEFVPEHGMATLSAGRCKMMGLASFGVTVTHGPLWRLTATTKRNPTPPQNQLTLKTQGKRSAKDQIPTGIDIAQDGTIAPERVAQTQEQQAMTEQRTHARRRKATLATLTLGTQSPLLMLQRGFHSHPHRHIQRKP